MGLTFLKNSVPDLQNNPEALEFLARYTNMGYGSVFLFLLFGTLLTIVVQSSSATMAITLIMCAKGWINFEMGAAIEFENKAYRNTNLGSVTNIFINGRLWPYTFNLLV
jgi:Na+/phosphate symporter